MLIMSTLAEIRSKYSIDGAVSVTVDLESMRDDAKSTLNNADDMEIEKIKEKYVVDFDFKLSNIPSYITSPLPKGADLQKLNVLENKRIVKLQKERQRACIGIARSIISQLQKFDADRADNYGLPANRVIKNLENLISKLQECSSAVFHLRS